MRCLEKDCNRRYESASGFAADVRRYLNDEPVVACPPSVSYRLGKFVRAPPTQAGGRRAARLTRRRAARASEVLSHPAHYL
jgi:hypothetical protein